MPEVRLDDRESPFIASEVEYLPGGWIRAIGYWPRYDVDDDTGDQIVIKNHRECTWPPRRVKEVRGV